MSLGRTPEHEPLIDDEFALTSWDRERQKRKLRARFCVALVIGIFIIAVLIVGLYFITTLPSHNTPDSNSKLGKYTHAAVASDVGMCSNIGRDILQDDGNAVDAAIAALLCMSVADPQSMGIGGGFFMTVYNRTTKMSSIIDARETAPAAATQDMFEKNPSQSEKGGLSVGIPGEIAGYWLAHQEFGSLPWETLFKPVIKMTTDGFPVPKSLASALQHSKDEILSNKNLRSVYINPETGELYTEGEILKDPKISKTFQTIATEGATVFYNGSLSDDIIADLKEAGSIITRADLEGYTALKKQPLAAKLNDGNTLYSPPPPAGGAVLTFIMNILDGYRFSPKSISNLDNSVLTYHRIVEAFKFAYAKRTDLGDEDFVDVASLVANLTSHDYADEIRSLIWDNQTHGLMYYGPTFYDQLKTSTAHLSIVDKDGNAVAVTTTVNLRFGSGIRGSRTGIIFNDEMDDFSSPNITNAFGIPPSPANFIVPGKRPLSSMCPAIFVDSNDDVKLVVGAAGGSRITTATAYVAARVLWLGDNIKQAIDSRRLHHQLLPPYISFEPDFDPKIIAGLAHKGHNISYTELGESIVQGVSRNKRWLFANCDFRKGGHPAGY
ncbi:glutathione hydrolase 1 proenzyme-like [Haliotis asinina]|uniref:glutathione hydrolase 1 proenzyme-like n=1 Tax=Haliotis asinina TaxID=109174 RepID=UPI00353223DC